MSTPIKLVAGDSKPNITVTLTDASTAAAVDLSDANTTVRVYFRAAGTTTTLSTITCSKQDAENGVVEFDFSGGVLDDLDAGMYEGEIEIDFNGDTHTVFDVIKFRLRDEF